MGMIQESHQLHSTKKQVLVCFDFKPILFVVATICRSNRKFILCPILAKLKLGLELKQKFHLAISPSRYLALISFFILNN